MFTRLSSSLSFFRLLFCFLVVSFSCSLLWAENEPDDDIEETEEESYGPLQIKSRTELCSADYYIKEGGEKDREEDRKRKNIGVGEKITLLLIGKPKGNIEELVWSIKGDGFQQTDTNPFKGSQKITLTAKSDLTEDTSATITAETSEGIQATIIIHIKVPSKIEGKKYTGTFEGSDGKPIDASKYKLPKGRHGLIGFIEITLSPTNVSFKNIYVIERDKGLEWSGKEMGTRAPALASGHTGHGVDKAMKIKDKNTFYDCVSEINDLIFVLNAIRESQQNPQEFWWVCKSHMYLKDTGKDHLLLGTTNQEFSIEALFNQGATKTTIKKFNVTFERNSNDD